MKHRRTQTHDAHRQKNQEIILGKCEQEQTHQGEAHANGESVRLRALVGIKPGEWLQDGRSHLEDQRDDANLCKREVELILHNRVDRGDNRLNHIIQEVRNTADDEHRIHRAVYHRGIPLNRIANRSYVHFFLLLTDVYQFSVRLQRYK